MSQLYVPDGALTLCTEGKKPAKIKVQSQNSIKIDGKLAATEADRFDGNFMCIKMMQAGALIGALVGAAVALTGGAALGGILAAAAVSSTAGFSIGKLTSMIPSVCSIITCTAQWSGAHDTVFFAKKRALLQNATLNCMLGGLITIVMKSWAIAYNMAMLSEHVYDKGAELPAGFEPCPLEDLPDGMKDMNQPPWKNDDSGFKARLYKNTVTDKYVLVFEGTDPASLKDWRNNLEQGVGLPSQQYEDAHRLGELLSDNNVELEAVAGHSLGGGLAAVAGASAGVPTYTYNAAGVHPATMKRYGITPEMMKDIEAYSGDHDILTAASDNRELILGNIGTLTYLLGLSGALPRNNGQRMELKTDASWFPNPIEGHGVDCLVRALKDKVDKQREATVVADDK